MTNTHYLASPIGTLKLTEENNTLLRIEFTDKEASQPHSPFSKQAESEINAYFNNPNHLFTLNLALSGTSFQRKVWDALLKTRPGTTITYGELARQLGTSARAIGGACRANPVPIIVPCHRVVGTSSQGGYMGYTTGDTQQIKDYLLQHEKDKGMP